jgi:hypothetical protein
LTTTIVQRWRQRVDAAAWQGEGIPSEASRPAYIKEGLRWVLVITGPWTSTMTALCRLSEEIGASERFDNRYIRGRRRPGVKLARKWLLEEIGAVFGKGGDQ